MPFVCFVRGRRGIASLRLTGAAAQAAARWPFPASVPGVTGLATSRPRLCRLPGSPRSPIESLTVKQQSLVTFVTCHGPLGRQNSKLDWPALRQRVSGDCLVLFHGAELLLAGREIAAPLADVPPDKPGETTTAAIVSARRQIRQAERPA